MEVSMKTKIALIAILAGALLFGACVGVNNMGVLDESIPEASRCNLEVRNSMTTVLYNDMPVNWSPGFTEDKVSIALPSGPSTFVVKWAENKGSQQLPNFVDRTATVSMEFLPGHSYRISKFSWNFLINFSKVSIKDVTPKK